MDSGGIRPFWADVHHHYLTLPDQGPYTFKLPWSTRDYHEVKVEVRRLDAPGVGTSRIDDSPTFPGAVPGHWGMAADITVPAKGCWLVTASNGSGDSASFIFRLW
jgi:hypothetical protein